MLQEAQNAAIDRRARVRTAAAEAVAPGSAAERVTAAGVLRMLRRRAGPLLAVAVAVPALTQVALLRTPPRWTASGMVLFEPQDYAAVELQSILRADPTTDATMASQSEIVSSLRVARRVADTLHLAERPEFNSALRPPGLMRTLGDWLKAALGRPVPAAPGAEATRDAVLRAAQAAIATRAIRTSRVLEVSFTSDDPALAAAAANLAMSAYIDDQVAAKVAAVRDANAWLDSRAAVLRDNVRVAEDRIAAYRAAHGLVQGVQAGLSTERVSRLSSDLMAARADLALADSRAQAAHGHGEAAQGAGAQAAVAPSVAPLRLLQEQGAARLQLYRTRLDQDHPDRVAAEREQQAATVAVGAEIGRVRAAADADLRAAQARVKVLEQAAEAASAEMGRSAADEIPLNAMQREADAARTLLSAVLERAQQTAQQTALEKPDSRIISDALVPASPSFPKSGMLTALSLACGVLLGFMLVWLLERGNGTLRGSADVRRHLGLPCSALVPEVRRHRRDLAGYVTARPLSPFAEQMRALRATLTLGPASPKVVAITAARPAEGKSTVAMCLARAAAMAGERVLLIDCDVREGAVSRAYEAGPCLGVVDVLQGFASLTECIRPAAGGVAILPAGSPEWGTLTLFSSPAMRGMLAELRTRYDLVLLDAPPACAMADARAIARAADATVLCVRWGDTPVSVVRHAIELLEEAQAVVASVALTRVDAREHGRSGAPDADAYHARYGGYVRA